MQQVQILIPEIGVKAACAALGVPRASWYRAAAQPASAETAAPPPVGMLAAGAKISGQTKPVRMVHNRLSAAEYARAREVLNSPEFADCSPREIYASLLDRGEYICHWRTLHRILRQHDESHERRKLRQRPSYVKPELLATAPNQVWSWDITWLRAATKGSYFKLYVAIDVFSRFVVGWMLAERETAELAQHFLQSCYVDNGIQPKTLTVHADNGPAMTADSVKTLFGQLDIRESHSRPSVSNDNPYSEAQFKTTKYHHSYPDRFATHEQALTWARQFFEWYNHQHYHVGLNLHTPASVFHERVKQVVTARQQVIDAVFAAHPERFAAGAPLVASPPTEVWINKPVTPLKPVVMSKERGDSSEIALPTAGET